MPQPYYQELAAALRQVAALVEPLADTDTAKPDHGTNLYLSVGYARHDAEAAKTNSATVDAIAAALGAKPETKVEGRGERRQAEYRFDVSHGPLKVHGYTYIPATPTRARKLTELEAENAELKARLAAQGGAE